MIRVKICGIQSLEEARWAVEAGADALGFILTPKSRRYIDPLKLQQITAQLPPFISKVGVFVGEAPDNVAEVTRRCFLDSIQLHGGETAKFYHTIPATKIKAFSFGPLTSSPSSISEPWKTDWQLLQTEITHGLIQGILLDSTIDGQSGGTGVSLPWEDLHFQAILIEIKKTHLPIILAGGLNPENIQEAIRLTQPYGVDVSSGVERAGHKDRDLIFQFTRTVKGL